MSNTANSVKILSFQIPTATWVPVYYKTEADGGNPATAALCYGKTGITWAKNDPKVKNMDGQEFEIMATGTFSLLTLKEKTSQTLFEVSATIDRAGTRCGATYIQNITL